MLNHALYALETAGWRALIGQFCHLMTLDLPVDVEHYLVRMLVRVGRYVPTSGSRSTPIFLPVTSENVHELAAQSLMVSSLFPEMVINFNTGEKRFIELVKNLYQELARHESKPALFP